MATLVQQPFLIVRLVDASLSRAEIRLHVRRTTSRNAGLAAARQLATLCDAASACSPDAILLRYPVLVTPEGPVAPGADNKRVGVLIFATTDPTQFGIVEILGIRASLQDPLDETLLLMTDPAIEAYIDALTSGLWCNPFGYVLTKCIAALFQYRQN